MTADELLEAIAVDVNDRIEDLVTAGSRRGDAIALVRDWWSTAAANAVDAGTRRIRLVQPMDEVGCSCHAGLHLDLPALARELDEQVTIARTCEGDRFVELVDLNGRHIGPARWCPWLMFVVIECRGDVELAKVVARERWEAEGGDAA